MEDIEHGVGVIMLAKIVFCASQIQVRRTVSSMLYLRWASWKVGLSMQSKRLFSSEQSTYCLVEFNLARMKRARSTE